MKYSEITFKGLLHAVRLQWKVFLLCVVLFAAVGIVSGTFYSNDISATSTGNAGEIWTADFDLLVYDGKYYSTCMTELSSVYMNAENYLSALTPVAVDAIQKEKLGELQKRLVEINAQYLGPINDAFSETTALYFPEEFYAEIVEKYETLSEEIRYNLIISAEAVELIKNMQIPTTQTDSFNKTYETFLSQAASHGANLKNQEIYRQILDKLDREAIQIRSDSRGMESNLNTAAELLNVVIGEINTMAEQIAQAGNLNITVSYLTGAKHGANHTAEIQTLHTYGEQTEEEVSQILFIFCSLCGVCSGVFVAVCKDVRREKKKEETLSEKI